MVAFFFFLSIIQHRLALEFGSVPLSLDSRNAVHKRATFAYHSTYTVIWSIVVQRYSNENVPTEPYVVSAIGKLWGRTGTQYKWRIGFLLKYDEIVLFIRKGWLLRSKNPESLHKAITIRALGLDVDFTSTQHWLAMSRGSVAHKEQGEKICQAILSRRLANDDAR